MKFQAVLFDLDGTLLDTLEDLADSMNAALMRFGLATHPVEAYKTLVGNGVHELVLRAAPAARRDDKLAADLVAAKNTEYAKRWSIKTKPYHGVAEMLDGLTRKNVTMTVLSNKPHDATRLCVAELLKPWRFEIVQGVDDSTAPKPDPRGAVGIAEKLGINPRRMLYLGDTNTDMVTANAAGMYAVGALWGFRTLDELQANGAKVVIERPRQLLDMLKCH